MPNLVRRRETKRVSKRTGKTVTRVSWVGQVPVGKNPDGSTRYLRRTFEKMEQADTWVEDVRREMRTGGVVEPSVMTVSDYLDHWLNTAASQSVRESTAASYRASVETYLKPHLGTIRLAELLPLMIQAAYAKIQAGGCAPRTVRYAHSVLHNALAQAVEWRMITRNPTEAVKLPKQQRKEITPLNAEEAGDFITLAGTYRLGALLELALVSGMRPGEIRALHWRDVDLAGGVIRVRFAMMDTPDGPKLGEPKTKRGNRTIPVPPQTVETLRKWKAAQSEEKMKAGKLWRGLNRPSDGLVFTSPYGLPIERRNLANRGFKPVLNRLHKLQTQAREMAEEGHSLDAIAAKLEQEANRVRRWIAADRVVPKTVRMYDLRHTCATLMLLAGVNPKIVSERLGHASVALTLDVYSHVLPTMQEDATAKLAAVVYGGEA